MLPLKDAVRSYAADPLIYQPGTDYKYSNEGINTAARIIEVVTGMPYERFMQERLFDPLGMKDTTFWPNAEQIGRLAQTYKLDPQTKNLVEVPIDQLTYPLNDRLHRYPMPAGGLFSTAEDVIQVLPHDSEWRRTERQAVHFSPVAPCDDNPGEHGAGQNRLWIRLEHHKERFRPRRRI